MLFTLSPSRFFMARSPFLKKLEKLAASSDVICIPHFHWTTKSSWTVRRGCHCLQMGRLPSHSVIMLSRWKTPGAIKPLRIIDKQWFHHCHKVMDSWLGLSQIKSNCQESNLDHQLVHTRIVSRKEPSTWLHSFADENWWTYVASLSVVGLKHGWTMLKHTKTLSKEV